MPRQSQDKPEPKPAKKYLVNAGLDYPPHKRAEPGDVVDDLPDSSVGWLLEQGLIEDVEEEG